jgi:hypothetical protein
MYWAKFDTLMLAVPCVLAVASELEKERQRREISGVYANLRIYQPANQASIRNDLMTRLMEAMKKQIIYKEMKLLTSR